MLFLSGYVEKYLDFSCSQIIMNPIEIPFLPGCSGRLLCNGVLNTMKIATANILGIFALLFWSMNVAVTRRLGEVHPFAMPGLSFLAAGILVLVSDRIRGVEGPGKSGADIKFWIFGGGSFVAYLLLYTCGLAFGTGRNVALPLGLVNYFWPSLILVLMPFFSGCVVRWPVLLGGMVLCVVGVGMSLLWGMSFDELEGVVRGNAGAF